MTPQNRASTLNPTSRRLAALVSLGFAGVLAVAAVGPACDRDVEKPPTDGKSVEQVVTKAGELKDPPVYARDTTTTQADSVANGEIWSCTERRYSIAEAPTEFPKFDPNAEVIWPGAALQGGTINSPTPERIVAKRGSGTVLINTVTGAKVSSVHVDEVTHASVAGASNAIIAAQPAAFPARLSISIDRVRTRAELALRLHANASFFSLFSSSVDFGFDDSDHYNRFLVQLNQSFYTLVFERPASIPGFFDPSVTGDDLRPFVGDNNPPVYVSSVTYGRIFYLLIESTERADSVDASISASFFGFGGGNAGVKHVSELKNLRVRAFALGGDANAALGAVAGGIGSLDGFLTELKNGNVIGTALPLSYTARSVRSDRTVHNGVAYDYATRNCVFVGTQTADPAIHFEANRAFLSFAKGTGILESKEVVTRWADISESGGHDATGAYVPNFNGPAQRLRPALVENAIAGHGALAFRSFAVPLVGIAETFLDFDATPIVKHDYTIQAVMRWAPVGFLIAKTDSCALFLRGASGTRNLGARLGFRGRNLVQFSHNNAPLETKLADRYVGVYALYTFRFSRTEGMSIWVNGRLIAQDPSNRDPLLGFPGAMLGFPGTRCDDKIAPTSFSGRIEIAEIMFFDQALPTALRQRWEDALGAKYGLSVE